MNTAPTEYYLTHKKKPVSVNGKLLIFTPKYLAANFGENAKDGSIVKLQGKEYTVNTLDAFTRMLLTAN